MEGHGFPAGSGPDAAALSLGWGPAGTGRVSSRHHQTRTLDYGYLLGLLEDLQAHWEEAGSLPQEQVGLHENVLKGVPGECCSGWDKQGQDCQSPVCWGAQPVGVVS